MGLFPLGGFLNLVSYKTSERSPKMPYIITTSMYPSDKGEEVAKRYLEAMAKYPPDASLGTQIVPAAVKTTLQGIKVIGITEVKKGKYEDALTRTEKYDGDVL
jgi:hypothetical protein